MRAGVLFIGFATPRLLRKLFISCGTWLECDVKCARRWRCVLYECDEKDLRKLLVMDHVNDGGVQF